MKLIRIRTLALIATTLLISFSLQAESLTIQSRYFSIHFESQSEPLAQYLARHADEVYLDVLEQIDAPNISHFNIVLEQKPGYHNASAQIFLEPTIRMHTYPFTDYELLGNESMWLNTLKHELSHAMSARMGNHLIEFLYQFGYLYTPNAFMPRGFQEGIAQVIESDIEQSTGRGFSLNSYYEQRWIDQYKQGFISYQDFAQIQSSLDAHDAYLYGAYFFSYVQSTFGENAINQWLKLRSNQLTWDAINTNSSWKHYFGQNLIDTWNDFLRSETARLENNQLNRQQTSNSTLIDFAKNTHFAGFRQERAIDVFKNNTNWLFAIKTPSIHTASYVKIFQTNELNQSPTLLTKLPISSHQLKFLNSEKIIYSHYQTCQGEQQLSLSIIDINTKKSTVLSSCEQGYLFDTQDKKIIWLHANGVNSELVSFDTQTLKRTQLYTFEFPNQISDFAVSKDAQSLVIQLKPNFESSFNLYQFDLNKQQLTQLTFDNKIRRYLSFISEHELLLTMDDAHRLVPSIFDLTKLTQSPIKTTQSATFNPIIINSTLFYSTLNNNLLSLHHIEYELENEQISQSQTTKIETSKIPPALLPTHKYKAIDSFHINAVIPSYQYESDQTNHIAVSFIANDAKQNHSLSMGFEQNLNNNLLDFSMSYQFKNSFFWESKLNLNDGFSSGYQTYFNHKYDTKTWDINSKIQFTSFNYFQTQHWLGANTTFANIQSCIYSNLPCKGKSLIFAIENKNGINNQTTSSTFYSKANLYQSLGKLSRLQSSLSLSVSDQNVYLHAFADHSLYPSMAPNFLSLKGYADLPPNNQAMLFQTTISHVSPISKNWSTYAIGLDSLQYDVIFQTGTTDVEQFNPTLGIEFKTQFSFFWLVNLNFGYSIHQGLAAQGITQHNLKIGTF